MTLPSDLDAIDRRILAELAHDGRISISDLAARVGLSKTPVTARLKRLETSGVILGYRAELSAQRLGLTHVAFVEVRLSDTRRQALTDFNQAVRAIPEVEECHLIAGGFDYLLKVRTRDIAHYGQILSENLSALPHVAATSTYVSIESIRDSGVQTAL